jgi:pilus assembly protein CpaB
MGKWKTIAPIAISITIAVAGSVFIYKWINLKTAPKEVVKVEAEAVPIVVAAVDLQWGTKLKPEMITKASYLKESLPVGHFTNTSDLNDRVIIASIKKGEPIVEHRLAPKSINTGGVSVVLESGMRAVAVKGDKVMGISGFVNPGNRVDVLVTLKDPRTKQDKTKVVLENIPVLATGTQIQKNEKGEPAPVDVYTLEVTVEEAEKLSLAASRGKLNFALRNITDAKPVLTKGTTISKVLASLSMKEPKKVKTTRKWQPRSNSVTVEVIKGNNLKKERVKL